MGNTQCNTCLDRLGHGRPSGPLIRSRRGRPPENVEVDTDAEPYGGNYFKPSTTVSAATANHHYSGVDDVREKRTSDRTSRRRPSVSPAALRRQQKSHAETEEEEEEEEDSDEEDEDNDEVSLAVVRIVLEILLDLFFSV